MTAGLHMKVDVIQINYSSDDSVGGAVTTGTTAYSSMPAVLTLRRPSQQSLEQGLEVNQIYDFTCAARYYRNQVTINERDEILVTWPTDHILYNLRFRVTGVQAPRSRTRNAAPIHCTLSRIITSRTRQ